MIANIAPYLTFNGNCEEAMNFYAGCLGGNIISFMRISDTPEEYQDPAHMDKIMHSEMKVGNFTIMGSDSMGHPCAPGTNMSVMLDFLPGEDIEGPWKKLGEGATVTMKLQHTFWGAKFGMLIDKYGISWMFNQRQAIN
jgi:PhnB protein